GAHAGRGLGLDFLRHIERTLALVLVLDASSGNVRRDFDTLLFELESHARGLGQRRRVVALNKIDLLDAEARARARAQPPAGELVYEISALARRGLPELVHAVARELDSAPRLAA